MQDIELKLECVKIAQNSYYDDTDQLLKRAMKIYEFVTSKTKPEVKPEVKLQYASGVRIGQEY